MVMIDKDGELYGIEGTVEELCENTATLFATVMQHVIEDSGNKEAAYLMVEVLTSATALTVIDLLEDEKAKEAIEKACVTVGQTKGIDKSRYKAALSSEGVMS